MKIRTSFVANSSSSSFLVYLPPNYEKLIDFDELFKEYLEMEKDKYNGDLSVFNEGDYIKEEFEKTVKEDLKNLYYGDYLSENNGTITYDLFGDSPTLDKFYFQSVGSEGDYPIIEMVDMKKAIDMFKKYEDTEQVRINNLIKG